MSAQENSLEPQRKPDQPSEWVDLHRPPSEQSPRTEAPDTQPDWNEIAAEAYAMYVADGSRDGDDLRHWLEAERRLIERRRER